MSAPAWMPLYVADYLADTGHLSTVEHGAYMLLIMHYWQNSGLPQEDAKLARIARMPLRDWQAIRDTIADLFADGWRHKRIDAELSRASEVTSKRSAAGKAGASARYGKRTTEAIANAEQTNRQPPSPSPSPLAAAASLDSEPRATRTRADLERIEAECRTAAGLEHEANPAFINLAPILGLLDRGCPLDTVLTVLRSRKGRGKPRSWAYFTEAIEDAWIAGRGNGSVPSDPGVPMVTDLLGRRYPRVANLPEGWPDALACHEPRVLKDLWEHGDWRADSNFVDQLGPPPGDPGCLLPEAVQRDWGALDGKAA